MPRAKRAANHEEELRLATELEIRAALLRYLALTRRMPIAIELQRDLNYPGATLTVRIVDEEK